MRDFVMLVLMLVMFGYMVYYKKRAKILEEGFATLAKMVYPLKSKADCDALAKKICEEQNRANQKPNKPSF